MSLYPTASKAATASTHQQGPGVQQPCPGVCHSLQVNILFSVSDCGGRRML
jgi:hypothetical protein